MHEKYLTVESLAYSYRKPQQQGQQPKSTNIRIGHEDFVLRVRDYNDKTPWSNIPPTELPNNLPKVAIRTDQPTMGRTLSQGGDRVRIPQQEVEETPQHQADETPQQQEDEMPQQQADVTQQQRMSQQQTYNDKEPVNVEETNWATETDPNTIDSNNRTPRQVRIELQNLQLTVDQRTLIETQLTNQRYIQYQQMEDRETELNGKAARLNDEEKELNNFQTELRKQ